MKLWEKPCTSFKRNQSTLFHEDIKSLEKKRKMLQLQLEIYANLYCLRGRNWTRWPEKRALPMSPSMGDWEYPRISKSVKTWDFSLNINGEAAWSTVKSSPHLFHCSFYLQSLFILMCISKPFCGLKYLQKIWLLFSLEKEQGSHVGTCLYLTITSNTS